MAPSPIPAPLPPWAKVLLWLAPAAPAFIQELFEFAGEIHAADDPNVDEWRHIQIIWDVNTPAISADRVSVTIDIANITNGAVDNSWTDADYTTVQNQISSLTTAWAALAQPRLKGKEVRYYRRAFNPMTNAKPFAISGPPERVFPFTTVGTGSGFQANQVAMTHTEKTPGNRHWGRGYWPLIASNNIDANGYFTTAAHDAWQASIGSIYSNLQGAEFYPVVPVTQVQGVPSRNLLGVTETQIDNVPDIVRRRRLSQTTRRTVFPV